jgi:hypothetical protein
MMRLKYFAAVFALIGVGFLATSAFAQQPSKKKTISARDHTVSVSRDEDGKTRTRIIIQKRTYLDPGTEPLPGERNALDYVNTPSQRADAPLANTPFGGSQSALPGPFTLPSRHNPWLEF